MTFTYKFDCPIKSPLIIITNDGSPLKHEELSWLTNYIHNNKPGLLELQTITNIYDLVVKEYPEVKDSNEHILLAECDYELAESTVKNIPIELEVLKEEDDHNYIISCGALRFTRLKKILLPFL